MPIADGNENGKPRIVCRVTDKIVAHATNKKIYKLFVVCLCELCVWMVLCRFSIS